MKFTYHAYRELLEQLRVQGYEFTDYTGWSDFTRCVILRHDIDYDINKAVQMAALERDGGGDGHLLCSADIRFLQCVFGKNSRCLETD